jgi:hypothetical protein
VGGIRIEFVVATCKRCGHKEAIEHRYGAGQASGPDDRKHIENMRQRAKVVIARDHVRRSPGCGEKLGVAIVQAGEFERLHRMRKEGLLS